jgi:hypothetical protein
MAALLLSGCGLINSPGPTPTKCPATGMLREGATMTRYSPNAPHDLTNVELAAQIVDVSANCLLEPNPRQLAMTLGLRVVAERGPAAPSGQQQLAYIVAVTRADQTFLNRQVYRLAATFTGTSRRAGFEEVLTLKFPLAEGQTAEDFRVYVSLALRPDELNSNLSQQ